jgi:hypothetical protein
MEFTDLTQSVHISAEALFTFLKRAEAKANRVKQGEGLVRSTKPWVRKRRRVSRVRGNISNWQEPVLLQEE